MSFFLGIRQGFPISERRLEADRLGIAKALGNDINGKLL